MRLVHSTTLNLRSFVRDQIPDYVILSHRWYGDEELTFEDLRNCSSAGLHGDARGKQGYEKFRGACNRAAQDGYEWIWIDSCCIDRSSSSELQESINSMWSFYARANICYAYLSDVADAHRGWGEAFSKSDWWSRGWTLQELLAPDSVEFYARDWTPIGTRAERHEEIVSITGISQAALTKESPMDSFSAAEVLSWAAHRQVTHEEDESYALLGLFEVNIPLLYGEGRAKAFARLQEAIYSATTDTSLFLFRYSSYPDRQPLIADGATRFCQRLSCETCEPHSSMYFPAATRYESILPRDIWTCQAHESIHTTVTRTRFEVSTVLQLLDFAQVADDLVYLQDNTESIDASHVAVLNMTLDGEFESALCLLLRQNPTDGDCFGRQGCMPALLPYAQDYASRLTTRKVLVVPDAPNNDQQMLATFVLKDGCGIFETWKTTCCEIECNDQTPQHCKTVRTAYDGGDSKEAEVLAYIRLPSTTPSTVRLHLVQSEMSWSIKELHEIRHPEDKELFSSPICLDRCTARLSGGMKLSVALRRQAAPHVAREQSSSRHLYYQILLS